MKKMIFIISLIIVHLIMIEISTAQSNTYIYDLTSFKDLSILNFDLYSISNNPAFLHYDISSELLHITSSVTNQQGSFRRFYQPESIRKYQLKFSGKKTINDFQIFKGSFEFARLENKNWHWVFSKNYFAGNPFLLGDSTVGHSRFNGIKINSQYGHRFSEVFSIGVMLDYLVDEGLKQISPRPTSEHRDISFVTGVGFEFSKNFAFGLTLDFFDSIEEINYREDEGALLQETILLKFRGYDYPFILKKKTESRIVYHNNYSVNFHSLFKLSDELMISGKLWKGIEQIVSKDEITNPINQGYWQNSFDDVIIFLEFIPIEKIKFRNEISFFQSLSWAKHPSYSTLLLDEKQKNLSNILNIEYKLNSSVNPTIMIGIKNWKFDGNDYLSDLDWYTKANQLIFGFFFDLRLSDKINSSLFYQFTNYKPYSYSMNNSAPTTYFLNFTKDDLELFQNKFESHKLKAQLKFKIKLGELNFLTEYDFLKSYQRSSSVQRNRKGFYSEIGLIVGVY